MKFVNTSTSTSIPINANYQEDIEYQLSILDKEYDVRNLILLFEKLLENSNMEHLLKLDHEDLKKVLSRDNDINSLLDK